MAKKKKPQPKATKAAGAWEITEAGNTRKYPWAAGLPAGAAFSISQDADGTVTFVAEDNCSGIFRGARKRMTDIGAGVNKLHQFHDGKDVTADSFRLIAVLDGRTFVFSGYRKKSKKGGAQDTGVIEIFSATRSLLTELKSPTVAVRALQHGGPHGEPRRSLARVTPDGGETHKLVGRWRIREPGGSAYPWSSGLPVDARFEITSDLKFVPGKGCTGKFRRAKKLKRPDPAPAATQRTKRDSGIQAHGHDDTLRMRLDRKTEITFEGDRKGVQKVWIKGPPAVPSIKHHGGPHGEPD
jgi:hypothetical protein